MDDGEAAVPAAHDAERQSQREFKVEYTGRQRDTSRVDAMQARFRVFCNDDYFQFFSAVASGPDLRLLGLANATSNGQFWRAFAEGAGRLIEEAVLQGEVPLPDPTMAYEVFPDVESAIRAARHAEELHEGDVVYEFRA